MPAQETGLYINEKEGLERLQGNVGVYHRLLASFAGKNMLGAVEQALAMGDREQAAGAAHALKGTAANLSMSRLYDAAFLAEQKLKDGGEAAAEMEGLRQVYGETLKAIQAIAGGG